MLGLILLNTFLNELYDKSKLYPQSVTKLGGLAHTLEGSAINQGDPDRLEKWNYNHFGKFSKEKYQVLHLGKNCSICTRQILGKGTWQKMTQSSQWMVLQKQKMYPVTERANSILGCIRRITAIRPRGGFFPFTGQALPGVLCPILESPVQEKTGALGIWT